jgi:hypothetical protein
MSPQRLVGLDDVSPHPSGAGNATALHWILRIGVGACFAAQGASEMIAHRAWTPFRGGGKPRTIRVAARAHDGRDGHRYCRPHARAACARPTALRGRLGTSGRMPPTALGRSRLGIAGARRRLRHPPRSHVVGGLAAVAGPVVLARAPGTTERAARAAGKSDPQCHHRRAADRSWLVRSLHAQAVVGPHFATIGLGPGFPGRLSLMEASGWFEIGLGAALLAGPWPGSPARCLRLDARHRVAARPRRRAHVAHHRRRVELRRATGAVLAQGVGRGSGGAQSPTCPPAASPAPSGDARHWPCRGSRGSSR